MREYVNRKYVVQSIFFVVFVIFILRLFYIQILDDSYLLSAQNNVLRRVTVYPSRGIIYDRKGEILVYNEAVYDLMIIPRQAKHIDTSKFCRFLNIEHDLFLTRIKKAKKYSWFKASLFEKQLSTEDYARIQERLYEFTTSYGKKIP